MISWFNSMSTLVGLFNAEVSHFNNLPIKESFFCTNNFKVFQLLIYSYMVSSIPIQ